MQLWYLQKRMIIRRKSATSLEESYILLKHYKVKKSNHLDAPTRTLGATSDVIPALQNTNMFIPANCCDKNYDAPTLATAGEHNYMSIRICPSAWQPTVKNINEQYMHIMIFSSFSKRLFCSSCSNGLSRLESSKNAMTDQN